MNEQRCLVELNGAQERLSAVDGRLSAARAVHSAAVAHSESIINARAATRKEAEDLVRNATKGLVDLNQSLETLQQALASEENSLAEPVADIEATSKRVEQSRAARAEAFARVGVSRNAHTAASTAARNLSSEIATLTSALEASGISENASGTELLDKVKLAASRAVAAMALRDKAAELEVLVDARATSAAFDSIRVRIEADEAIISEAEKVRATISPWVKYFEAVSKLLSGQQALATAHFTTEYGPRTATIQRRLRPVYGFDDISVTSKDSTIEIHVSRNGQQLRPTDFFSQSQVQTLVLGLFLTACSSQSWSGFSSVLMDDPVSHFDDLNTYALLDLISGLQSSPEGMRQFVISTCDEKLLQLARQKFRYLGDAAKFYRFQAIGRDGPLVSELPL